jgi:N-methylhydantoinase A
MDIVTAADGALRIVESQMADLMRQMTVERGLDPRDFVVYAFGGAGAAHAVAFARELGCAQVVVPLGDFASTWSALGVMTSDVVHVHEHAELVAAPFAPEQLNEVFARLERDARAELEDEGFAAQDIELLRSVDMKFSLQINQLEVPVPGGMLTAEDVAQQVERFVERYEQTYGEGSAFTDAGTQIGIFRVFARGRLRRPSLPEIAAGTTAAPTAREVYWRELGQFAPTNVYAGADLGAGLTLDGPAIVDLPDTTVVVPPGASARVDRMGSIVIEVGAAPAVAELSAASSRNAQVA